MALVVNVVVLAGIQGSHPTKFRPAVLVVQNLVKNKKKILPYALKTSRLLAN